jgi:predicted transcriptional regulator
MLKEVLRKIAEDYEMPKQNITIRLDPETVRRLDQMAQAMERDRSWLMSHAIERYVEDEAWQVKAIREAVRKVKEGRGRFVPHEEVAQWLDSWGTDNELPPPQCR